VPPTVEPRSPLGRPESDRRRLALLWGPVVLYCAFLFACSSVSQVPPLPGGMSDKAGHGLLYSGLGFLVARALAGGAGRPLSRSAAALAILLAGLYGLTDEIHQWFVPPRQVDMRDLLADVVGAAAGTAGLWLCGIIRRGTSAFLKTRSAETSGKQGRA